MIPQILQHGETHGTRERIPRVSMTAHDYPGVVADSLHDSVGHQSGSQWRVTSAQSFAHRDDIRDHVPMLYSIHLPGATYPGHHIIYDQEQIVPVADFPHTLEVAVRGHYRPARSPDDRFSNKSSQMLWTHSPDRRLQFCGAGQITVRGRSCPEGSDSSKAAVRSGNHEGAS